MHHKDGNKLNNDLSNLELIPSQSEHTKLHKDIVQKNLQSPESIQKRSVATKIYYSLHSHPSSIHVLKIDPFTNTIVMGYTSMHTAEKDGFNHRHISACCSNKRKTHGGFQWKLEKDFAPESIYHEEFSTI